LNYRSTITNGPALSPPSNPNPACPVVVVVWKAVALDPSLTEVP